MLNKVGFHATNESVLAGFIPSFYVQAGNESVPETTLNGTYTDLATLPISPASGTPLLAMPRTKTHAGDELRLFFRRKMDGKIAVFERDPSFTAAFNTDGEPALPFGTLGGGSILAGFTTVRSAGTKRPRSNDIDAERPQRRHKICMDRRCVRVAGRSNGCFLWRS